MRKEKRRRSYKEYFHNLALVLIPEHGVLRLCPKRQPNDGARKLTLLASKKQKLESLEKVLAGATLSVNEVLRYEVKDSEFNPISFGSHTYVLRPGLSAKRFLIQWASRLDYEDLVRIFSKEGSFHQRPSSALATSALPSYVKFDNLQDADFIPEDDKGNEKADNRIFSLRRSLSVPAEIWLTLSQQEAAADAEKTLSSEFLPESSTVPPNTTQATQYSLSSESETTMLDEFVPTDDKADDDLPESESMGINE
ncbi:unnamed protein product [Trichobilharzia szidati]|nr:unnamed protein product [Trichobilharzia szidati]